MRALGIPAENTYEGAGPGPPSFNGSHVGSVNVAGQQYACRWTEREGLTFLKEFPPLSIQCQLPNFRRRHGHLSEATPAWVRCLGTRDGNGILWKRLVNLGVNPHPRHG